MQNKNHTPQRRSTLPCTLYRPSQSSRELNPNVDKRLCAAVISLLLLFAVIILIVSAVKGSAEQTELPLYVHINGNNNATYKAEPQTITVCIDPGHGFDDPGAQSDFTDRYEKDLNLEIALVLAERLEELGYDIIMTRDSDLPPESLLPNESGLYLMNPNKRTEFIRNSRADAVVSIHCNALEDPLDVSGTGLYYYGPSNPLTLKFANVLCNTLRSAFPERNIETVGTGLENSLAVNRDVSVPSVLVEVGYLTSRSDCALLCDSTWCRSFAFALAEGIDEFMINKK